MKARLLIALVAALGAGCGGLLIIQEPGDGGVPCCDGGLPDGGQTQNGPPDQSRSSLLVLPDTTVVADGNTTVTIRVTVRDSAGHLLQGIGVTMTCDGTANAFIPSSGSGYTGTDGTFQAALRSTVAEPKTASVAVAGGFTLTQGLTFVAGRPDPGNSTLVANPLPPTTVLADGVASAAATATLRDQFSNIVAGYPVAFTSTGSNNTFTPAGAVNTDAQGVASTRLSSTRAESKTLVATVGSLFVMTRPLLFSAGGASQTMSSLTANPTSLPADGTTKTTLTVLLRDANGNVVGSQPVTFSATGSANTFSPNPPNVSTSVDGVARVQLSSTVAETKTVSAQAGGVNLSTSVRFGAGTPTNGFSSLAVESPILADGVQSGLITVTLRDATNNPTPGIPVQVTSSGSLNTFTAVTGGTATDLNGQFQWRLKSPAAETKAVTVTTPSFQLTNFMVFNPGPPVANSSQMDATPQSVPADGVSTTTLTASFRDANGNPCPGLFVQLAASGSSNTLSATTGTTDASGAFSATLRSPKAELKTVSATAGGLTQQVLVAFNPGPPSSTKSSVSATPANMTVGFTNATITATVKDALGNPVPNVAVSIAATGSNNFFEPSIPSGLTGAAGTFQVGLHSYTAEVKTIGATFGSVTLTTPLTFVPDAPYIYASDFTLSPGQVKADGVAYSTATVTARDSFGNPVSGCQIAFAAPNGADRWSPSATGNTNASGVFSSRLSSTVAETKRVSATVNGAFSLFQNVTFVP